VTSGKETAMTGHEALVGRGLGEVRKQDSKQKKKRGRGPGMVVLRNSGKRFRE